MLSVCLRGLRKLHTRRLARASLPVDPGDAISFTQPFFERRVLIVEDPGERIRIGRWDMRMPKRQSCEA